MFVHWTKRKKENGQKNKQIQLKFDYTAYQFVFVVSKRRKFRFGKMYKLLGITQSKLRMYGNGNHFNYLGDDHLILRGVYFFQFFACQKLYYRLFQDRLFISGYNNVESGVQARLLFLFSWTHRSDYLFSSFWRPEYLFPKTARHPSNQMVVHLVHLALNAE